MKMYTTRFGGNKVEALRNVNFSVEEGEYVAIMGESGSGKTTLLNILASIDRPSDGEVILNGVKTGSIKESVILITAYADINLAVRGLKNGAADFVTKPWDNEELLRTLKSAISKSKEIVPLEQIETEHIQRVVEKCHGNISRAAELLGITRQTLYAKIRK